MRPLMRFLVLILLAVLIASTGGQQVVSGSFFELFEDDFSHSASKHTFVVQTTSSSWVALNLPAGFDRSSLIPGATISVNGNLLAGAPQVLQVSSLVSSSGSLNTVITKGLLKVHFVALSWAGASFDAACSADQQSSDISRIVENLKQASWAQLTVVPTLRSVTITPPTSCLYSSIVQNAAAAGIVETGFHITVYMLPSAAAASAFCPSIGWSAAAAYGGTGRIFSFWPCSAAPPVSAGGAGTTALTIFSLNLIHAMGHVFGLNHAGMNGNDRGDPTSVMGSGSTLANLFNAVEKNRLGWFISTRVTSVSTVPSQQKFYLRPYTAVSKYQICERIGYSGGYHKELYDLLGYAGAGGGRWWFSWGSMEPGFLEKGDGLQMIKRITIPGAYHPGWPYCYYPTLNTKALCDCNAGVVGGRCGSGYKLGWVDGICAILLPSQQGTLPWSWSVTAAQCSALGASFRPGGDTSINPYVNYIQSNPSYFPDYSTFLIGNEIFWDDDFCHGGTCWPDAYLSRYVSMYRAIKAINPTYQVGPGAILDPYLDYSRTGPCVCTSP